ncbi:MAG: 23S rRNA (adenine(1618)-N(6))-methyltransferase RlmF [Saprospiraceae bacterium]|nr:23S rRNA (adenine(1618)-N(6))-methyltransferase RlmF [Saprospiraceae bacterium]
MDNVKKTEGLVDKKVHPEEKTRLHKRNQHRMRYDFKSLIKSYPDLKDYIILNKYGEETIDFSNNIAVRMLNSSLLVHYYGILKWEIPTGYLCPPIPGRADYIHYVADLLSEKNYGKIPPGKNVRCLDIGVGAACIYPIIGIKEYNWNFVGSDIDSIAINSAGTIINDNPILDGKLELRLQTNAGSIFQDIIHDNEYFDLTICNPPFHTSFEDAQQGSDRKVKNLKLVLKMNPKLNFGGMANELWCEGGEHGFIQKMISESQKYSSSCFWFTTLISKQSNLKKALHGLERVGVKERKIIPMGQGNKTSRLLAWTFLDKSKQELWRKERWAL